MTQTTGYQTTIAESWRIQCRVLSALVRREFIASYGRRDWRRPGGGSGLYKCSSRLTRASL